MNYLHELPSWPFNIIAALIAILGAFQVQRFISARNAAERFRSTVLTSTKGLYPVSRPWPDSSGFLVFKSSVKDIRSAAVEFRRHISRKAVLDDTVTDYCNYCEKAYQEQQAAWELYTSTREELGQPEPRKEFERLVHNLLLLAKEK